MKAFSCFILLEKFAKNFNTEGKAVKETLMLVVYPLPLEESIYRLRRGSGLFISVLGVWRCLSNNKLNNVLRFLYLFNQPNSGTQEVYKTSFMKKQVIVLGLLVAGLTTHATKFSEILITMLDGSTTTVLIDKKPIVKVNNNVMTIESTTGTTIELDRAKVARFNFIDETNTNINTVQYDQPLSVEKNGDLLIFNNLTPNSEIRIYSFDGILIKSVNVSGNYTLNTLDMPSGVYIVTVNGVSSKIAITK